MRKRWIIMAMTIAAMATGFTHRLGAAATGAASHHVMLTPAEIKWGPFPSLGNNVQVAILSGDPYKAGSPFVFRIELPDGYKVAPHWHPVDEHLTVISGNFLMGTGETFSSSAMRELPPGSYAYMPKHVRHFAQAKGDTVIQLSGTGPFKIIYVNPADDPARKNSTQESRRS